MKTSRGSLALFIGTSTGLLIALLSSLFIALASTSAPRESAQETRTLPPIRAVLPQSYSALVPLAATSTTVRGGETYILNQSEQGCALIDKAAPSSTIPLLGGAWCQLSGASIEGRYIHLLSGTSIACAISPDSCESAPIMVWSVYDLRTHILRPVPVPVRGGVWEAVDPIRSIGLFRGAVRSTIRPGEEDFWALTDPAGAAFWTGRIDDVDLKAQIIAGERLFSRPDNSLLLSYLVINPEGNEELRLATFNGKIWKRVVLPETVVGKTWRLEAWVLERGKWTATMVWQDEQGQKRMEKVTT